MNEIDRRAFFASLLGAAVTTGVAAKIPGLREAVVGHPWHGAMIDDAAFDPMGYAQFSHHLMEILVKTTADLAIQAMNQPDIVALLPAPPSQRVSS